MIAKARYLLAILAIFPGLCAGPVEAKDFGADALTRHMDTVDPRATGRRLPPFDDGLVACEGYRAADLTCEALVWTDPDAARPEQYTRNGKAILAVADRHILLLLAQWRETARNGYLCLNEPPHFSLQWEDDPERPVSPTDAFALTLLRERTTIPLCSFWTGEGKDLVEITYDLSQRQVGPESADEVTRFMDSAEAVRARLRPVSGK